MQRFFLVLVVVALFSVVDAASTTSALKLTPATLSNDVQEKRFLRIESKNEKDNGEEEERAIAVPDLSKLSKVKEWPAKMKGWSLSKVQAWVKENYARFKAWYADYKQVQVWTKEKKTPDDVFRLLELDQNINNVLNNRKLTTYVRFMRSYNKKNENGVTLIGTLTKFYDQIPLVNMLELSRKDPDTMRLANRLQNDQLTGWLGNGLTMDIVYKMLKINEGGVDKLMANPALRVWSYFSYRKNGGGPESYVLMIKQLATSYKEMELAKAIQVATKDKTTEFISKRLQTAQFKVWKEEGRTPKEIFNKLNLDTKMWPYDPNVDVYRAYKLYLL